MGVLRPRQARIDELLPVGPTKPDVRADEALDPLGLLVKPFEIAGREKGRGGERLQCRLQAVEVTVERGRGCARNVDAFKLVTRALRMRIAGEQQSCERDSRHHKHRD